MRKEWEGTLTYYSVDGCDGLEWHLELFLPTDDSEAFFGGMEIPIQKGDHLVIFNPDGSVLFDAIIDPDEDAGRSSMVWVRWVQRGWNPNDWAQLFVRGGENFPPFRAKLMRECAD